MTRGEVLLVVLGVLVVVYAVGSVWWAGRPGCRRCDARAARLQRAEWRIPG